MSTQEIPIVLFLKELMCRRRCLPSQLAADLGVSHSTVSRWLSGEDIPNPRSCRHLAEYSGIPLEKVFSIGGYLPSKSDGGPSKWPEFGEYAHRKYPEALNEDEITVIENLIELRRRRVKH